MLFLQDQILWEMYMPSNFVYTHRVKDVHISETVLISILLQWERKLKIWLMKNSKLLLKLYLLELKKRTKIYLRKQVDHFLRLQIIAINLIAKKEKLQLYVVSPNKNGRTILKTFSLDKFVVLTLDITVQHTKNKKQQQNLFSHLKQNTNQWVNSKKLWICLLIQ